MRLFSLMCVCEDGMEYQKIRYLMYLLQFTGVDLKYKFRFGYLGFTCEQLSAFIDDSINKGYLYEKDDKLFCKKDLSDEVVSADCLDLLNYIKEIGESLSLSSLNYVATVGMVVSDDKTYKREKVLNSINLLTNDEYTEDDFNEAMKIINTCKRIYK